MKTTTERCRAERSAANRPIGNGIPNLKDYIGQTLITTGTTLLGSDDKSGIAEIVTAMETLIQNPAIPHGSVLRSVPTKKSGPGLTASMRKASTLLSLIHWTAVGSDIWNTKPSMLLKPN